MARDVYSLRIFAAGGVNVAAGRVGPLVPNGLVYVVRDIDIWASSGANNDELIMYSQVLGALHVWKFTTGVSDGNFSWRGRQVYNTGEQVAFQSLQGTWSIACSGYQLTLP